MFGILNEFYDGYFVIICFYLRLLFKILRAWKIRPNRTKQNINYIDNIKNIEVIKILQQNKIKSSEYISQIKQMRLYTKW